MSIGSGSVCVRACVRRWSCGFGRRRAMRRCDAASSGCAAEFDALVNERRESATDVSAYVAAIVARGKAEGDAALADYTARFDRFDLDTSGWSISKEACAAAYEADRKSVV